MVTAKEVFDEVKEKEKFYDLVSSEAKRYRDLQYNATYLSLIFIAGLTYLLFEFKINRTYLFLIGFLIFVITICSIVHLRFILEMSKRNRLLKREYEYTWFLEKKKNEKEKNKNEKKIIKKYFEQDYGKFLRKITEPIFMLFIWLSGIFLLFFILTKINKSIISNHGDILIFFKILIFVILFYFVFKKEILKIFKQLILILKK